jgi:hypothetical protein
MTSMADIVGEVSMTSAQFVMQWSDVMHGSGCLKNVQLEGQHDCCMKYVFNLYLGGIN